MRGKYRGEDLSITAFAELDLSSVSVPLRGKYRGEVVYEANLDNPQIVFRVSVPLRGKYRGEVNSWRYIV